MIVIVNLISLMFATVALISVLHLQTQAREHFTQAISGTDLIVGARTGSINLMLYTVFRIGNPTNNIRWESYESLRDNPAVNWVIPISLGDSHHGYRVVGTTGAFFDHYQYRGGRAVVFGEGQAFTEWSGAVLGYNVAKDLQYTLGSKLTLSHGVGKNSFSHHDAHPFTVVGILEPTGTPVDQAVYVSLEAIEKIHIGFDRNPVSPSKTAQSITAAFVGLNNKTETFRVQRMINGYAGEPLTAVLPGIAMVDLWRFIGTIEQAMTIMAALVFVASIFGLVGMLLATMRARAEEFKLYRTLGARPWFLVVIIELEAMFIVTLGLLLGVAATLAALYFSQDWILREYGLLLSINIFHHRVWIALTVLFVATLIVMLFPALMAYQQLKTAKPPTRTP